VDGNVRSLVEGASLGVSSPTQAKRRLKFSTISFPLAQLHIIGYMHVRR
jgi:hypothetical protein